MAHDQRAEQDNHGKHADGNRCRAERRGGIFKWQ
jgi:hypothetical protein